MPNKQQNKIILPLTSEQELAHVLVEISSKKSDQPQVSYEGYMSALCNDPGQGGVYLVKLLRTHSLPFENIVKLQSKPA
jgi:hypothetical protein